MYRITVTRDGFYRLLELTEKSKDVEKYVDCDYPEKYLVVVYEFGYDFNEICNYHPNSHILCVDDYDQAFELVEQICDQVLGIEFQGGGGSIDYEIITDEHLSSFQNITNFFVREADVFSVKSNKLLFYMDMDANYNYQKNNPDLIDVVDNSMKLLFEKTNFEAIEYTTVKDLRKSMNIDPKYPDDSIICKYGFTDDLSRRLTEHIKTYKKIDGCELRLKQYCYVDPEPKNLRKAEKTIKIFVEEQGWKLNYQDNQELFVVSNKEMERVVDKYDVIAQKFLGKCSELINALKYEQEKFKREIQAKEHEIKLRDHEIKSKDYELKLKDQEIKILKLEQQLSNKK